MTDTVSFKAVVFGQVQGVGFRYYTRAVARRLGICGYAKNLPGGKSVETEAEGDIEKLEKFLDFLKTGPPLAKVDRIDINWSAYTGKYPDFSIRL